MKRLCAILLLTACLGGCGDDDDDVPGEPKKAMPMDQVPATVLAAAKKAAPDLTFYAAFQDKFKGQDSIELKGKTKSGKIVELELSPDGKVLGTE